MLMHVRDNSDMVGTRQVKVILCYNLHGSMVPGTTFDFGTLVNGEIA